MAKETITEFGGKIIGFREDLGNRVRATDFYGKILGYYEKDQNRTTDFNGRIICSGDGTVGLIMASKR